MAKELHKLSNDELTELFARAIKKAIAEEHAAGRPTMHGDEKGIYKLYPDGHKEYSIPRACGDEPKKSRFVFSGDCMFPAHAGMNRTLRTSQCCK